MVISLYEELTKNIVTSTQTEVKQKLIDLGIAHIFAYVLEAYEDKNWLRPIVMYAAFTYSWETTMVQLGHDWKKQKRRIAERVSLPPEAYDKVVDLNDERMADVFRAFLGLYKDRMDYMHYTSLKDLYQQIMANATKFVSDEAGNANMDKKFKDMERADELKAKIEDLEEKITKKYRILNQGKEELQFDDHERKNVLLIENSKMIRR